MLFLFAVIYGLAHGSFFTAVSPTLAEFFGTGSHGLLFGIVLFSGTLVVMLLYIALNYVFLSVAPMDAMRGEVEVGYIAARSAFGEMGGKLTGLILAALLISCGGWRNRSILPRMDSRTSCR